MRKAQVEKLWGVSTAGCFDGANVCPYCREMAVVKDEVNSLKVYPCSLVGLSVHVSPATLGNEQFFLCGQGLN